MSGHRSGYAGFESIKRCWKSLVPGANITFPFYGREAKVAIYQHPDGMGVFDVYLDNSIKPSLQNISSYFPGYPFHPGGGRQEIIPLFSNLTDTIHSVTFVATKYPGNPIKPGYALQIVALLYSSESADSENITMVKYVNSSILASKK